MEGETEDCTSKCRVYIDRDHQEGMWLNDFLLERDACMDPAGPECAGNAYA